jgi:hypothetical protein
VNPTSNRLSSANCKRSCWSWAKASPSSVASSASALKPEIFYVDLVFYNYLLKCFVLIDLKTGELAHQDIGQMDMYVRLYEDKYKSPDDNPTIGIILCTDKDETVVKYSVLKENKRLFASKYKLYLPSEKELIEEIEREKALIVREREARYGSR